MKRNDKKRGRAVLYESIESICPDCGHKNVYDEPGWKDKPQDDGLSFMTIKCRKCGTYYLSDFNLPE